MIKVKKSPPIIMVTRKPMVYESLSKRLIMQGKYISPQYILSKVNYIVVWLFSRSSSYPLIFFQGLR
jgi:hypothetical protein